MPTLLARVQKNADLLVAVVAVLVVVMFIIPIPSEMLDILITINIAASLIVLLITMYTRDSLEFSVFPTLLLATTLFRLALNISSTKLILLEADAGQVISAFGNFVVGGNVAVGLIIFLILVIVQYVVITNGSNRVAEVAARFTLDAMPGKQMAIDADLNSGIIAEEEARDRRKKISDEAEFYGSMDGASKFVKGDAIASIIIVFINLIGGLIIGMTQRGLDFSTAGATYSLLSVGDGLVSQIPALLISVGTGIVVTRSASAGNLGEQLTGQLFNYPRALMVAAVAMLGFAIVPGLPTAPFALMGISLGIVSYILRSDLKTEETRGVEEAAHEAIKPVDDQPMLPRVDSIELEIGHGLISLVDASAGGDLIERITSIRKQVAQEFGFLLPPVRVRDNVQLAHNVYAVKIKGVEVARGDAMPGWVMAMSSEGQLGNLEGIDTTEPVFGLPARWIAANKADEAELQGFTVIDSVAMIATHITEVVRSNASELLGRQDVSGMLDLVKETHPAVVGDIIPEVLSLAEVHRVLQNLLSERIPIRDLITILEVLGDKGRITKDLDLLTEFVRQGLARQITQQYKHGDGSIHVLTLDPQIEQTIVENIKFTEHGSYVVLEPSLAQQILERLQLEVERMTSMGYLPILLCSAAARPHVNRFFKQFVPKLVVISHNEVDAGQKIESRGMVSLSAS